MHENPELSCWNFIMGFNEVPILYIEKSLFLSAINHCFDNKSQTDPSPCTVRLPVLNFDRHFPWKSPCWTLDVASTTNRKSWIRHCIVYQTITNESLHVCTADNQHLKCHLFLKLHQPLESIRIIVNISMLILLCEHETEENINFMIRINFPHFQSVNRKPF